MTNLENIMAREGMTDGQLAKLTDLSIDTIGRFRRGEREPRLSDARTISLALRTPLDIVFPALLSERSMDDVP